MLNLKSKETCTPYGAFSTSGTAIYSLEAIVLIQQFFRKASAWFLWFSIFVLALVVYYNPIIFQEGSPLPLLRAALNLETSQVEIVPLTPDQKLLLQKAGPAEPLHEYMKERGWKFQERFGSAIIYGDDGGATFYVEARMFTRRYIIYELDSIP